MPNHQAMPRYYLTSVDDQYLGSVESKEELNTGDVFMHPCSYGGQKMYEIVNVAESRVTYIGNYLIVRETTEKAVTRHVRA